MRFRNTLTAAERTVSVDEAQASRSEGTTNEESVKQLGFYNKEKLLNYRYVQQFHTLKTIYKP